MEQSHSQPVGISVLMLGACKMAAYNLRFLNSAGEEVGARTIKARSNFDAMEAAKKMAESANCAGFELSNKRRMIARQYRKVAGAQKSLATERIDSR